MLDRKREELAWAAGFFDGEGHVGFYGRSLRLTISQIDPEVLYRFVSALGVGKVNGPYRAKTPNSNPYWSCSIAGYRRALPALAMMWTWLGTKKREDAKRAIKAELDQSTRKWAICKANGHDVVKYLFKDKHFRHHCRTCQNVRSREFNERKREVIG